MTRRGFLSSVAATLAASAFGGAITAAASVRAKVEEAKAKIGLARYDEKHTKIYAPIGGVIGKSSVYPGDFVAPSKKALARIVQSDPCHVPDSGRRPHTEHLRDGRDGRGEARGAVSVTDASSRHSPRPGPLRALPDAPREGEDGSAPLDPSEL